MLKGEKKDIFREMLLIISLLHYVIMLYTISLFLGNNIGLFTRTFGVGLLVFGLIMDYLLQFFLWTSSRTEKYVEGNSTYILIWTVLLLVFSAVFLIFINKNFKIVFLCGVVLLTIYCMVRYRVVNFVEEPVAKHKQLENDTVSILFLTFTHVLLSGMVLSLIYTRIWNIVMLVVGAFILSEFVSCYINIYLLKKKFTSINVILLGVYCFMFTIVMIISVTDNVFLKIEYVLCIILAWCFLISKIKKYEVKINKEVD